MTKYICVCCVLSNTDTNIATFQIYWWRKTSRVPLCTRSHPSRSMKVLHCIVLDTCSFLTWKSSQSSTGFKPKTDKCKWIEGNNNNTRPGTLLWQKYILVIYLFSILSEFFLIRLIESWLEALFKESNDLALLLK
jgi:hypothetical protein